MIHDVNVNHDENNRDRDVNDNHDDNNHADEDIYCKPVNAKVSRAGEYNTTFIAPVL